MSWLLPAIGLLSISIACHAAEGDSKLGAGLVNPGYHEKPDWFKQSFLDLQEDVEAAAGEGKRLLLYFHQDGCPYCAKLLRVVLRINGYYPPHLFETALDYVASHLEQKQSFKHYLADVAPVPSSGTLHQEESYLKYPLDLRSKTRDTDKPLLVLIEQKQCVACDELHDSILSDKAVRKSLKGFDIALVDAWSKKKLTTPDGQQVPATEWVDALNLYYFPAMVFFNGQGDEVFRTEAFLKTFHTHAAIDYVLQEKYRTQPSFQRYVRERAEHLETQGIKVELMK
ncbi:thioredoxin SoxW [endosymbiont of Tevnia jerichonana (vent Tica)]|uniref:Thioredoxin SoxW n=1 Tax=endosymbiont of Tevnia jerichonana (vent Tica) TaxID=1049564 RepID=G2FEB8_9GAMM|nr:thioredoxin SoxW [endosymbiont of Tevnia jerichonana (vent Tica)]